MQIWQKKIRKINQKFSNNQRLSNWTGKTRRRGWLPVFVQQLLDRLNGAIDDIIQRAEDRALWCSLSPPFFQEGLLFYPCLSTDIRLLRRKTKTCIEKCADGVRRGTGRLQDSPPSTPATPEVKSRCTSFAYSPSWPTDPEVLLPFSVLTYDL